MNFLSPQTASSRYTLRISFLAVGKTEYVINAYIEKFGKLNKTINRDLTSAYFIMRIAYL